MPKVVKGAKAEWGTCSRTVPLKNMQSNSSYWNNSIAVASWSNIIILDVTTGSQIAILSDHTSAVTCLTFSSDGKSLVSGSSDKTVKLWDMQTGGVIKTFHGHTMGIMSVSISADCTKIASGCWDNTLRLWDIQTGDCLHTINHQDRVQHVSFSPMDPQHLISVSDDKVQWWDINGHKILPAYDGSHISFSPDHTQFALCNGKVVTVLNSDSRGIVAEFHVANHDAKYCCFSPDGRLVAAAAAYETAYVWDIASPDPHLVGTFVGHTTAIKSLVFSSPSSLISGSEDQTVKFWKIGALPADQIATDSGSSMITSSPIRSISLQPRAGIVISSDVHGVVKTWDLSTGLCKATFQIPAIEDLYIKYGDAKFLDGRLIFAWYHDMKICIWDTEKEELLKTLDMSTTSSCEGLRISGDGSKVFFLHDRGIQAWHMWTWEPVCEVALGLEERPYLDSLYTDSSRVWIHYKNLPAQEGWDFVTSPVPFDPSTGRPHLDFIGGNRWQTDCPSWIEDTATGKKVFQLDGRYAKPNDVQWDGQYLVAGYHTGEVLILHFHHFLPL